MLDTSSGASMAIREMLIQLVHQGYEVMIVGATIFDAENGTYKLKEHWQIIQEKHNEVIKVNDGVLTHHLVATKSIVRNQMTTQEEGTWYGLYTKALNEFKPDLVYFYGGQTLDMLIPDEARARGIPNAAYLCNGNYKGTRWCRDVDVVITDSQATADFYKAQDGYTPIPVGAFIDPSLVIAQEHQRKNILFVNPSLQKGAGVVVQLAMLLEKQRPDIPFEVIESRGNWHNVVKSVTAAFGEARESLSNVTVTPNTDDMRPIYGRARVLLAPSLWWESAGRVIVEAMLNGIPAIVTDRGGCPEMMQNGGLKIEFPENCHEKPFTNLPLLEILQPLVDRLIQFYDDEALYQAYVARAYHVGQTHHALATSTNRLMEAFAPLIKKKAGDGVEADAIKLDKTHKAPSLNNEEHPAPKQKEPTNIHEQFLAHITSAVDLNSLEHADQKLYKTMRTTLSWRLNQLKTKYIQECGLEVKAGPLSGLSFVQAQTDGCLLPKLLGCYEQPLLPHLEKAITDNYDTIVDIGSAEGYYAVGLAYKMPKVNVYAHDINPKAQETCQQLAIENKVFDRVHIGGLFEGENFEKYTQEKTLIICDIEGAEKELLNPELYPALKELDIIVESHDCIVADITQLLISRFSASHNIELVTDNNTLRTLEWQPEWFNNLSNLDQLLMLWEMREGPTPWLVMKAKNRN